MIRNILVTLDESQSSNAAKQLALIMAKSYKASVTGIGVLDETWIAAPEAIPLGGTAFKIELDEQLLKDAKHRIHKLERLFLDSCKSQNIPCSIIDVSGVPAYEIEHFAIEHDILIIGKDVNFHFSSTQETTLSVKRLLKNNPRPVIVTGPHLPYPNSTHILVAFDGTFASSRALHMAILIGILQGKTLHIASVSSDEDEARYWVTAAAKLCEHHGMKAHLHPIAIPEKPSTALMELMDDLKPFLGVLGAFGHSGLSYFFTGSCAKELLKITNIPLFIYH